VTWWLLGLLAPSAVVGAGLLIAVLFMRSDTRIMGCRYCTWRRNPASSRAPWWWTENLAWWRHRHSHQHRTRREAAA
jgi:hypothetical protein